MQFLINPGDQDGLELIQYTEEFLNLLILNGLKDGELPMLIIREAISLHTKNGELDI